MRWRIVFGGAALVSAMAPAAGEPGGADLHLICEGGTAAQVATGQTTGVVTTSKGGVAVGRSVTTEPGFVPMTVRFRMTNGKAEINVPAFAGVRSKGDSGGWSEVKGLVVTDEEIAGKVSTGLIGSSRFRIDRRTGEMTSGGGYRGDCRVMEASERRF